MNVSNEFFTRNQNQLTQFVSDFIELAGVSDFEGFARILGAFVFSLLQRVDLCPSTDELLAELDSIGDFFDDMERRGCPKDLTSFIGLQIIELARVRNPAWAVQLQDRVDDCHVDELVLAMKELGEAQRFQIAHEIHYRLIIQGGVYWGITRLRSHIVASARVIPDSGVAAVMEEMFKGQDECRVCAGIVILREPVESAIEQMVVSANRKAVQGLGVAGSVDEIDELFKTFSDTVSSASFFDALAGEMGVENFSELCALLVYMLRRAFSLSGLNEGVEELTGSTAKTDQVHVRATIFYLHSSEVASLADLADRADRLSNLLFEYCSDELTEPIKQLTPQLRSTLLVAVLSRVSEQFVAYWINAYSEVVTARSTVSQTPKGTRLAILLRNQLFPAGRKLGGEELCSVHGFFYPEKRWRDWIARLEKLMNSME